MAPRLAKSHEFTVDSTMTAVVKIEDREAHLVVRVPLHLLRSARFPLKGLEIDLPSAGPAVQRAVTDLTQRITLSEDSRALVPSSSIGRLSLPSDRSFDRYADAARHVAQPLDLGTSIYTDQRFVDAHLTYAITSPHSQFSIQTAVAPELRDYLKLALRYLPLHAHTL